MKKTTIFVVTAFLILMTGKSFSQDVVDLTASTDPMALVDALDGVNSGTIILLKPGMTYVAGGFAFVSSVVIQSSEPANLNRPKIDCADNFNFGDGAEVDSIIFRNLEFSGDYESHYVINSNVAATIGKIMFEGCKIHSLRGIVRTKDAGPGVIDEYIIDNSVVSMIRDYGVLTVDREDWQVNHITFTNTTFMKLRRFLTSSNNSLSLTIEGCTMSEIPAAGERLLWWRTSGQDNVTEGILIKNTLVGTGWDEDAAGTTAYDAYDGLGETAWWFENVWLTSDLAIAEAKDSIVGPENVYPGLSTELWVDPANGNLHFGDEAFTDIGIAGDQRWATATDDGGIEWNISTPAYAALGTVDSTQTIAGLTIFATPDETVVIDDNGKTVGDMSFTQRLKLGGSGSFDSGDQPANRVLSLDVLHSSMITVAAMSSNSSSDRVLNIAAGDNDNLVAGFPAMGAELTMEQYEYYGGPTKLFLYSPNSGVNVYYIKLNDIPNMDSLLSGIALSAGELSPAFDPASDAYTVDLPYGTSAVTVTAALSDPNASVTGDGEIDVSSGTGTATITVLAEDGAADMVYTVDFTVLPNSDASLSDLTVDEGILDPAFATAITSYTLEVPSGTTTVNVTATATDPIASVSGDGAIDVSSGGGTATVLVTAEDGTTTETYSVDISVLVGVGPSEADGMRVYPTYSDGRFNVAFAGVPGKIEVYDMTGNRVLHRQATTSIEQIYLNVGVYMIRMTGQDQQKHVRVVSFR